MTIYDIGKITANIQLYDGRTIEIKGKLLELDYEISGNDSVRLELISEEFKENKKNDR